MYLYRHVCVCIYIYIMMFSTTSCPRVPQAAQPGSPLAEVSGPRTRSAYDIMGNNFKVQVYFHRVSPPSKLSCRKTLLEVCIGVARMRL